MIKCYNEDTFGDDSIGSARVNLEGLVEGSIRDVWIPLEKVNSGELRLQIEAVRVEGSEGSRVWEHHVSICLLIHMCVDQCYCYYQCVGG